MCPKAGRGDVRGSATDRGERSSTVGPLHNLRALTLCRQGCERLFESGGSAERLPSALRSGTRRQPESGSHGNRERDNGGVGTVGQLAQEDDEQPDGSLKNGDPSTHDNSIGRVLSHLSGTVRSCAAAGILFGMGDLSPHFSRREFACRHCGTVKVTEDLVAHLELLRAWKGGRPLKIVSGYRCTIHNRAVGGAPGSRHLQGDGVDLPYGYATASDAKRCGFTGIGVRGQWAVHVDRRPGKPARWTY